MLNSTELWADAVGYEGYYEISNLGRVRTKRTGKIKGQNAQTSASTNFSTRPAWLKAAMRRSRQDMSANICAVVGSRAMPAG